MVTCHLLLGGNVGNRRRLLLDALRRLDRLPGCRVAARSRLYETAAVGRPGRPYLNMAARLRTRLSPMGLLVELKRLEAQAGRRPGPRWGPRPLDVDILSYGRARVNTRWLAIPHPLLTERAFALAPLAELAPAWKPRGSETVVQCLARLNPRPGTVKIYLGGR